MASTGYVRFGNGTRLYYLVLIFICVFVCVATFINSVNYHNALSTTREIKIEVVGGPPKIEYTTDGVNYGYSYRGLQVLMGFNVALFVISFIMLCFNFVFLIGTFSRPVEEIELPIPKDNDIDTKLRIEQKLAQEFNRNLSKNYKGFKNIIKNQNGIYIQTETETRTLNNNDLKAFEVALDKSIEPTVKDVALQIYRKGGIKYNDTLDYSKYLVDKTISSDITGGNIDIKRYLSSKDYIDKRNTLKKNSEDYIKLQNNISELEKKKESLIKQKSKIDNSNPKYRIEEYKLASQITEKENQIRKDKETLSSLNLDKIKNELLNEETVNVLPVPIDTDKAKQTIDNTNVNYFKRFYHYMTNRHEGFGMGQYTFDDIVES